MLGKKSSREEDQIKENCENFEKGECKLGSKCPKKHGRRNQFKILLQNANINEKLLKEDEDKGKRYSMRSRNKVEPKSKSEAEDKEEDKEENLKRKLKEKRERKARNKKDKLPIRIQKELKSKTKKEQKKPKEPKKQKEPKKPKAPKKDKKTFSIMTSRTKIVDEDCEEFLKGECSKTFCDKIHNFSLKFKEQNNEEFARRYFTIYQDFTVLEPFQRKLYGNSTLDLMFLVDCTGSMGSWIQTVKEELKNVISFIKENNPYSKVRISFVGYRDIRDEERFSILDFTEDAEEAKQYISGVLAVGGADTPEDLAGGLKKGLEQNWMETSAKYCILVCDSPCHGEKYHTFDDDYPQGCPNGLVPENLIEEYGRKQISFYALKIKDYTNQMYNIFSAKYQEITKQPIVIADLGKSTEKFAFLVAVAANSTLSSVTINNISLREFLNALQKDTILLDDQNEEYQTKLNNFVNRVNTLVVEQDEISVNGMIADDHNNIPVAEENKNNLNCSLEFSVPLELKLNVIENKFPNFNNLSNSKTFDAICHSYIIKKDRYTNINWKTPFIQHSEMKSKITISQDPFSEGCNRYAFYMKENNLNENLVAKIPKILTAEEYSIEGLNRELEAITICNHIVNDFNDRIVNLIPDTRLLFNFIHCYIYEILDPAYPYKYYTVENHIQGEYVKYNNNAGWINTNVTDQTLLAQAFSHFSWQITKGYLCVVDLQGVGGFLTDPQIHCLNKKKFGNGNFGYIGMMKFFMSHNCNAYCKKMELIHPKNFVKIDKEYNFFVDKYIPPEDYDKNIYKLCDICRGPYHAKSGDLYNLRKKCWEGFCDNCENKRKSSFQGGKCMVCQKFFKSSAFIYKMKRNSFPDKCMKCRQEDRNKLRDDFYRNNIEEEN